MHQTIKNLNLITKELSSLEKKLPSIIAVSKTFSLDKILPLIDYGHLDYGENKVQDSKGRFYEDGISQLNEEPTKELFFDQLFDNVE